MRELYIHIHLSICIYIEYISSYVWFQFSVGKLIPIDPQSPLVFLGILGMDYGNPHYTGGRPPTSWTSHQPAGVQTVSLLVFIMSRLIPNLLTLSEKEARCLFDPPIIAHHYKLWYICVLRMYFFDECTTNSLWQIRKNNSRGFELRWIAAISSSGKEACGNPKLLQWLVLGVAIPSHWVD